MRKLSAFSLIANYIETNNLGETYQSAYKSLHSTETALLRVHDDILGAIKNNRSVALLLLDLLAAFDRIDHGILLHRLGFCFGVKGSAPRHTREKTSGTQGTSNNALSSNLELVTTHTQGTEWTRIWLYYQPS